MLSTHVTIGYYRHLEKTRNRRAIAAFIRSRFEERYLTPADVRNKTRRNGFAMMALCCLTIEALESFKRGWPNTRQRSEQAFCSFFDTSRRFADLRGHAPDFYKHVRCGILHQAETTGGWRILRSGPLFDRDRKTVNAARFLRRLRLDLQDYCRDLSAAHWDSEGWRAFRKKMASVAANTDP